MIQAKAPLQEGGPWIKRDAIRNVAIIANPFLQGFWAGSPVCLMALVPLPTLCH